MRVGYECLGYLGVEVTPRFKRIEIFVIWEVILKLKVCAPKLLQVLCSPMMNCFLMRRPLMSLLEEIFEYMEDDSLTVFMLAVVLLNELFVASVR